MSSSGVSDKQKVVTTLALLTDTCTASRHALTTNTTPGSPQATSPPLEVIRKDFISLLTLAYTNITKISLVLRPQELAYGPSMTPLQDLVKHVNAITTCATFFTAHGKTISEDARKGAQDVLENIAAYAKSFSAIVDQGTSTTEDYLVRTGAVHESVDRLRRDLPLDNVGAVKRRWSKDREMLEDSVKEAAELAKGLDEEDLDDDNFGDDLDDEWDELGLGSTRKMSEEELERTKKVEPLLRMAGLLHKRVLIDILRSKDGIVDLKSPALDDLPDLSHNLLISVEDLLAVLYSPQDTSAINNATNALNTAVTSIKTFLYSETTLSASREQTVDSVTESLQDVTIHDTSMSPQQVKISKWFDTCFAQLHKLSNTITNAL